MKQMKQMSGALLLLLGMAGLFSTCDKNNEQPQPPKPNEKTVNNNIAVYTTLPNAEGNSGAAYLQLANDSAQTLTNTNAIPVDIGMAPIYHENDIYTFPTYGGSSGSKNEIIKFSRMDNGLKERGRIVLKSTENATSAIIVNAQKGYITLPNTGKVMIFNPTTMAQTGEIDLLPYTAQGLTSCMPGVMCIREGLLYVSLNQAAMPHFTPLSDRPWSDIAIIDMKTEKVQKVIVEKTSGVSMAARPIDPNSMFVDEKGDMYIVCIGSFGAMPTHKTGILRIKKGATEFDTDYSWPFNEQTIEGDPYRTSWIETVLYGGNGKLYAFADIQQYKGEKPNFLTDKSVIAIEIDLYAKKVRKLPIPHSSSYSVCMGKYKKDQIMFGSFNEKDSGFYVYDPKTGKASKDAVIKVTGYPYSFHYYEK